MKNLGVALTGGNNKERDRQERDYYPTPTDVTFAILQQEVLDGVVYEPACGNGAISLIMEAYGYQVVSSDIEPVGYGTKRNFFEYTNEEIRSIDTIITNPPFYLSVEFIEHAAKLRPSKLVLLLKSTYWHAARRKPLWDRLRPNRIYPLLWRPDFLGLKRPTMEVAWNVWDFYKPNRLDETTTLHLLPRPTKEQMRETFI